MYQTMMWRDQIEVRTNAAKVWKYLKLSEKDFL